MNYKAILIVFFLVACVLPAEAQCAMCRAVLESEEGNQAAKGINNGIVYLMIFPYILVAGIAFLIIRNIRRSKNA